MKKYLLFASLISTALSVDYSQNGKNWNDTLCASGSSQSPVNIDSSAATPNDFIKFSFSFMSIENATLQLSDGNGKLKVDMWPYASANPFVLWNEYGEKYQYYLDSFRWKTPSEHTVNNRQFAAELQIIHKQFQTNRRVVLSILFDEELSLLPSKSSASQKTCFVDSFRFTSFTSRVNDLEIPLREYLAYIPQDFYYYHGSMTEPPCTESVTWIVFKTPQIITTAQVGQLRALVNLTNGNNRAVQARDSKNFVVYTANSHSPQATFQKAVISLMVSASTLLIFVIASFA
ncbi:hypothetical protein FGO68_gene15681 [Halteria grandinella]|uniref:Alpha-carbonic anhydrase domain-containing protein n=1 Tax=Halteria grandinella TaxID=5974 RepID=A0A8J8NLD4_HALGN|nr:hypothetical protein FGO68_gene15681 [Halteria grandinella]